jgi:8-amino-7-oxononanoate synthase
MASLSKQIRPKRFTVKTHETVKVLIETPQGVHISARLGNCSLTGLGCFVDQWDSSLAVDTIFPALKLTWKDHEFALGRVVLKTCLQTEKFFLLGFATIDTRLPLDGPLSHLLELDTEMSAHPFQMELDPDKFTLAHFRELDNLNIDLFYKAHQFQIMHQEWKKKHRYSYHNVRLPSKGSRVLLDRTRKSNRKDYIIMGSNDYLGFAAHPEVMQAAKDAIDEYGFGSTGSPVTTGISKAHEELSSCLADLFEKQKVLLFNSGYTANIGIINGLTNASDLILADTLSHASIQDAIQMSKASSRYFKHNDLAHLESLLKELRSDHNGCLIITEGIFSMDGDYPPLKEMVRLARAYNARIMVDEAHSFGVLGENGLGLCEKEGLLKEVDLIMGTFSKICGGIGGFVACNKEVADWLKFFARAHMFTVSIPPSTAKAALKALEIFTKDKTLLKQLQENIRYFVRGLQSLGYPIKDSHSSSVIPVVIGDEPRLEKMNEVLMEEGVFVVPIIYPAVSRKACRFRFTVMASHTLSDLDYVISVLEKAMIKAQFHF